jgi:hypothetical protein
MAREAGFTPQAVPPKILFPLLEGASFEEDEGLHDMWAALLANAASASGENVRPGFIALLREMAPDEAKLLNWLYDTLENTPQRRINRLDLFDRPLGAVIKQEDLLTCLDSLESAQLVRRTYYSKREHRSLDRTPVSYHFMISDRGRSFVHAVRPPKPKE